MNRREFIMGTVVLFASVGVAVADGESLIDDSTENWLREHVSFSALPRSSELTGALSGIHRRLLHGFFHHLGDRWKLPASSAKKAALFDELVSMKTNIAPSYLIEYREAAAVLMVLGADGTSPIAAYERLLGQADGSALDAHSRLGRVRKFVSAEFIAWLMAKDGYARFGYQNYRGLMAGSFAIHPPPYRHL